MNVVNFGNKACEMIRRYLDSYLSNELLVETNLEVLRHLDQCPACSTILADRQQMRSRLREAVKNVAISPKFIARVQSTVLERSHQAQWPKWAAVAVAALLLITLGVSTVGAYRTRESLLRVGLADHVDCALTLPKNSASPTIAEMRDELGPEYSPIIPVVEKELNGYRVMAAHLCEFRGRVYTHMALQRGGEVLSVILTKKIAGEKFPRNFLLPALQAAGGAMQNARLDNIQVTAFETGDHLAYVISSLDSQKNLEIASRIAVKFKAMSL